MTLQEGGPLIEYYIIALVVDQYPAIMCHNKLVALLEFAHKQFKSGFEELERLVLG